MFIVTEYAALIETTERLMYKHWSQCFVVKHSSHNQLGLDQTNQPWISNHSLPIVQWGPAFGSNVFE